MKSVVKRLIFSMLFVSAPVWAAPEMLSEAEIQMLESYTAPSSVFNGSLCSPPLAEHAGGVTCTTLPLDWDKPFKRFPVAIRFYEPGQRGLRNTRGQNLDVNMPYFFVLDVGHGKVVRGDAGEMQYDTAPLEQTVVLKPNEVYFFNAVIGQQTPNGVVYFSHKLVVPRGTVVYTPYKEASWSKDYSWNTCKGENAPLVEAHTTGKNPNSHHYKSAEPCKARYTVNTTENGRAVTSYVLPATAWFSGSGSRVLNVQRHFKVSAKDPPGAYRLELWQSGKLIARGQFEVRP